MANENLILDRYQPIEEAGRGKFGQVVAAYDPHIQRMVAIKIIQLSPDAAHSLAVSLGMEEEDSEEPAEPVEPASGFPEDPDFLDACSQRKSDVFDADARTVASAGQRVKQPPRKKNKVSVLSEAQAAGGLGSPNIVAVHDLQLKDQTAYLIMEYVDGMNLADFLAAYDDELTLDIIAAVVDGVANALKVAHKNHVLHLDIKPANILIGNDGAVKLTDFGMAALSNSDGDAHGSGGTIGYMPPEQLGQQSLDERCDEWALASVAYLMLLGKNPFVAADLESAQSAIKNAELVVPSLVWDDLDEEADDVLFGALHPDREGRYASIRDFANALVPLLGKPKQGERQIAELLEPDGLDGEDDFADEEEPAMWRVPLRERFSPKARGAMARSYAAIMAAGISVFSAISIIGSPLFQAGTDIAAGASAAGASDTSGIVAIVSWVMVIGIAVLSAAFPRIAPLLAYAFLGIALITNVDLLPGIVLIVATVAWWLYATKTEIVGDASAGTKRARAAANVSLSEPLAGCVYLGPMPSLIAGCCLSPGKAAATAAHSFVVAFVLGGIGAQGLFGWDILSLMGASSSGAATTGFLALAQQPGTWICGASWILGALVFSALRFTKRDWLGVVGALAAGALVVVAPVVSAWLSSGGATVAPDSWALASAMVSAIVGVVLAALLPNAVEAEVR